jgi:hypothetical protein
VKYERTLENQHKDLNAKIKNKNKAQALIYFPGASS